MRLSRFLWIGAVAILVVAALIALLEVVSGEFSDRDGRVLGMVGALILGGSTIIAGAAAGRARPIFGWLARAVAVSAFVAVVYGIWSFGEGDNGWRWLYSGVLVLVATLMATTARLTARTARGLLLASIAGALAMAASLISLIAIWQDEPGDAVGKVVGVLWILAGLSYLCTPLLQRIATKQAPSGERVLATLDEVELVATRSGTGLTPELALGEQLALRPRPRG